jgi:hypothetical protein
MYIPWSVQWLARDATIRGLNSDRGQRFSILQYRVHGLWNPPSLSLVASEDYFTGKRWQGSEFDRLHHVVLTVRKGGPIHLLPLFSFTGRIPARTRDFPPCRSTLGSTQTPVHWELFTRQIKRPACEDDQSPPSDADFKDVWNCTYAKSPFALIKFRETTPICMTKPAQSCPIHTHLTGYNMWLCCFFAISCMQRS